MPIVCQTCDSDVSPTWWKCCPKHTTERGRDVVCQNCANDCLSGKEIVVSTKKEQTKQEFITSIADYVETGEGYSKYTKRDAVMAALRVLTEDIGAAQSFVNAIGVKIDLYEYDFKV